MRIQAPSLLDRVGLRLYFLGRMRWRCRSRLQRSDPRSAGEKFDNELDVDHRVDLFGFRKAIHGTGELVALEAQPVHDRTDLSLVCRAVAQLLGAGGLTDADDIPGLHLEGGNVDAASVHLDVTVADELARGTTGAAQTQTIDNIVKTAFQKLHQNVTGNATAALRLFEVAAKLLLQDTVLETKLLLLTQSHRVVAALLAGTTGTMLTGRVRTALKSLGGTEQRHAKAAADSVSGTCVSGHIVKVLQSRIANTQPSDGAGLLAAATIVRNAGDVLDAGHLDSDSLNRTDGGFPTRTRPLDADLGLLETVRHGLAASVLGHNLPRISGALAGSAEAHLTRAGRSEEH